MKQHHKIYNPPAFLKKRQGILGSLTPEIYRLLRKTKASFRSAGRLCCPSGEKERLLYAEHKAIGVRQ